MKRVGILTSGGDCQGLNATIRAVAKTLYNQLDNFSAKPRIFHQCTSAAV